MADGAGYQSSFLTMWPSFMINIVLPRRIALVAMTGISGGDLREWHKSRGWGIGP